MSHTLVTGRKTGFTALAAPWQLPQRLEWQDFVRNDEFVTLYVKGLEKFQGEDESAKLSYYQIAGLFSRLRSLTVRHPRIAVRDLGRCARQ